MENELRASRDALEFLWRRGLSGKPLLMQHTDLIDATVSTCFRNIPGADSFFTLVALGGYGRKELFPYSDIDLMLLYSPEAGSEVERVAGNIFYPLWDAGLEVGHAARTPEECLKHGRDDFYFQVAMLDARPVAGSETLFRQTKEQFHRQFIEGKRRDFFINMTEHMHKRHQRYGSHIYQLEPNIKECRGGLRDIQAILWTAEVVFGLHDIESLEEAGLFSKRERQAFEGAWNHLIKIRNRLHYISKRKNDRLFFEHQEEMAQAFGFKTGNRLLAVEQFMQQVYTNLRTIAVAADHFFEHVDEVLHLKGTPTSKELEPGIHLRNDRIHLLDKNLLAGKPEMLMHIFEHAARLGAPVHYRTKKLISQNLHLIDDRLRSSKTMARAFLNIIQGTEAPLATMTAMLDTGLINHFIPEFDQVASLAQHDIYHTYTVDRHLVQTVAELKFIRHEQQEIFAGLAAPQVLYLAALLHDIGKGLGGDHCLLGADLVERIGRRLHLAQQELEDLVFVVRHHLFLSNTAMRRDLEDDGFIISCARLVQTPERLTMLYLLSIADAKATGEGAWSDWKAALLHDLYLKIKNLLEGAALARPDQEQGAEWMRGQVSALLAPQETGLLATLPEDYLVSFPPQTIAEHLRLSQDLAEQGLIVRPEDHGHFWSVLVMAPDSIGLLAKLCGTLALHDLEVVDAQIFTWENRIAVDQLNVRPAVAIEASEFDWQGLESDLRLALANRLGLAHRLIGKKQLVRYGAQRLGLRPDPQVLINNMISERYTLIEIFANDRTGLLYEITKTLSDFCINIYRAKIGSRGDQVVDVFYVLDTSDNKIEDEALQNEISRALLHVAGKNN